MKTKYWIILVVVLIVGIFFFVKFFSKNNSVELEDINSLNNLEKINMKIESDIFLNNEKIPVEYTCDGESKPISLKISDMPENAKSLALIVDDPDAPNGDFVHWVVWNIDPKISEIESGEIPNGAVEGINSSGRKNWVAPCPPSGIHHYYFKLSALDTMLDLPKSATKADLLNAMSGHILENSMLTGLYGKN